MILCADGVHGRIGAGRRISGQSGLMRHYNIADRMTDMRPAPLACLLALLLGLSAAPARAAVDVLATIRPLALIAEAVGGERVSVTVLLPPGTSPHHFSLRPSQRQQVEAADLVFWGGPALERPLTGLLRQRSRRQQPVLALEPRDIRHESHAWLDPAQARDAATRLATILTALDADGADYYAARLAGLHGQLQIEEMRLRARLAPLTATPLLLDHDFLDVFWVYFGLSKPWVVRSHPEHPPGSRHLLQLAEALAAAGGPLCYLRERSAPPDPLAQRVTRGATLAVYEADVLAEDPPAGGYAAWLGRLGDAVADCLTAAADKKKP